MRTLKSRGVIAAVILLIVGLLVWINLEENSDPGQKDTPELDAPEAETGQVRQSQPTVDAGVPDYGIPRTLRYRLLATNRTGETLENARLTLFSPMGLTATQKLTGLESNQPFEIVEDHAGNRVMEFVIDRVPPYAVKIIDIEARLLMADAAQPLPTDTIDAYLGDGPLFDLDHPKIIETANSLAAENHRDAARAIYDWVKNYLNYSGYIASDRGAAYAMRTQKGDCTEYAYLLAALARLNEIPARIMAGFVYDNNAVLRPYDYHNWVELFVDGRWQIADPLNNAFFPPKASHVALRVLGGDGSLSKLASQKGIQADPRLEIRME